APPLWGELRRQTPVFRAGRGTGLGRTAATKQVVHIADLSAERVYIDRDPLRVEAVELIGVRTVLFVPMLKENTMIGTMTIYRQEVRPFTEKQIELVQNFAAQAVIAIENTRLLNELRQRTDDLSEALEQQTATSEVLRVISSSPGELEPVFNTILEKAHQLCGAAKGALVIFDGEVFRAVATRGVSQEYAAMLRAPQDNPPGSPPQLLLQGKRLVHVPDMGKLDFPIPRAAASIEGVRTVLFISLRKDDTLLGYITVYREEVCPFTDRDIALLENFAAQAVVAIENTRLLNELRQRTDDLSEALDQQTATSEVLQVISSSPGELEPVFQAM